MNNNNSDEDIKSIKEIKENKKKIKLSEETKITRSNNLQKARDQRKLNTTNNKTITNVENELKSLFNPNKHKDVYLKDIININNSDIDDEEEKKPLIIKKNILPEKNNNDFNDDKLNKIYEKLNQIDNINKRVEKLYIMKKNKPSKNNQPIIINNEHKKEENNKIVDKNQDLINSLKNRMFNN